MNPSAEEAREALRVRHVGRGLLALFRGDEEVREIGVTPGWSTRDRDEFIARYNAHAQPAEPGEYEPVDCTNCGHRMLVRCTVTPPTAPCNGDTYCDSWNCPVHGESNAYGERAKARRVAAGTVTDAGEATAQQGACATCGGEGTTVVENRGHKDHVACPDCPPAESAAPAVTDEAMTAALAGYDSGVRRWFSTRDSCPNRAMEHRYGLTDAINAAFPVLTAERGGLAKEVERMKAVAFQAQNAAIDLAKQLDAGMPTHLNINGARYMRVDDIGKDDGTADGT